MSEFKWWQRGVVYQVYPRSLQDTTGNGIGDLNGITQRLDYFVWLGVDILWLSPFYPSPMADNGYDVSNYADVDPLFGSMADFNRLVEEMHARGLRLVIDLVPNHTSDEHPWFIESRSSRSNPKRDWYYWRDPKADGSLPNNWRSSFGGPAWTFDETTKQYYLHSFDSKQPDLNWRNPEVKAAMYDVMRFWLDQGVDGFRIDMVSLLMKDQELRDNPPRFRGSTQFENLFNDDMDDIHPLLQDMRKMLIDEYEDDRVLIGELWVRPLERWARYYGDNGNELHLPFNFTLMTAGWSLSRIADTIQNMEDTLPVFAWPNYVLGSHDAPRLASRIGQANARMAAMLLLTLRGTPTLYYGDELGMELVYVPLEKTTDPQALNEGSPNSFNRDSSRSPMQWTAEYQAGFTMGNDTWIPLSDDYQQRNVDTMQAEPESILMLYRNLLHLRQKSEALQVGGYTPVDLRQPGTLAYIRQHGDERLLVILNFNPQPVELVLPTAKGVIQISTHLNRNEEAVNNRLQLHTAEGVIISI